MGPGLDRSWRPLVASPVTASGCGVRKVKGQRVMESIGIVYMDLDVPGKCDTVFCVLDTHEDDKHMDVTGHTWTTEEAPHLTPKTSGGSAVML